MREDNRTLQAEVAERKRAEQALVQSEERFRSYFELGLIGMATTSPNKSCVEVNDEICRILGYERSELLRMTWAELTHPDDLAADVAQFNRVLAGEIAGYSMDKRFIRKDGQVIDATISGKCLRRTDGSVDYFVVLLQDITGRKRSEQVLRESEERLRAILESALDCIVTMDHQGRVVEFNPAAEKTFGYKRDATIGQLLADLIIPPALRERHRRGLLHYLSKGESPVLGKHIELTGMRSDHSEFPVELAITRIGLQEPPMFTGFIRDITDRKQAEEAVRKANRQLRILSRRRIQEQEDERRRLSRELHDQIGQSLTAAKLNVETLRSSTSPALVGRLDETTAILDRLLEQVRQISLDLRPPMLDDLGLVAALRSWLGEQGRRASVAVRFSAEHVPEILDPEIQITCFRIAQEAITNAVRHAKATQLDIALRCARGKKLQLLARDNGIGFDAQSAQAQAVDLGLIGIRERAALVGGQARITSSPSKGTTIQVSLPLTFRPEGQARRM